MKKGHNKLLIILLLASILVISTPLPALAHKAVIFAWAEGDTIITESKLAGGKRAIDAQVLVFDREGKQLLEGRTNNISFCLL